MPLLTRTAEKIAEKVPDRAFAAAIAVAHRRFEPVLAQVPTLVRPDQTAVDVGAWYGPWTQWLARRAREVVTVEANPALAEFVRRTAPPNVTVINAAASDHVGSAELWLPPGGKGTEGRGSLTPIGGGSTVTVDTIRIDDLELADVGVLKVDVEGHELAVLLGAEQTVRKWRPYLVVEIEASSGEPVETIPALLEDWGYRGSFYTGGRWRPLAGFDLEAHQRAMRPRNSGGYLQSIVTGTCRQYVNTVVFRPVGAAR